MADKPSPKMAPSTENCRWGDKDGSSPPCSHLCSGSSSIEKGGRHPLVSGTWELKNSANLQCQPFCLSLGWQHPTSTSTAASKPLCWCCSLGSLFQWGLGKKRTLKHQRMVAQPQPVPALHCRQVLQNSL